MTNNQAEGFRFRSIHKNKKTMKIYKSKDTGYYLGTLCYLDT